MAQDVFVLGGKRTPMGEYVGALKDISAIELGAIASRATLETTGVAPEQIDHAIFGNALQTSGDAIYGARHVALKASIPFDRPALTVNRLCGSGIQSIISGAQMIQLGEAQTVSGWWYGINVAGAACYSWRTFRIRAWPRQVGGQFDGRVARHLLQHADGRYG